MELGCRAKHDRFLPDGAYRDLEHRLGRFDPADRPVVVVYAFDRSTIMLPYLLANQWMAPAGARAIGASLAAVGFNKVRIVLQQWTPNFDPRVATFDGRPIQMLCISSMQIHSARAIDLVRQAHELGPDRPLIVVGGAKAIYEPHGFFCQPPKGEVEADVAVLGEEYVFLAMLERILASTGQTETLRQGFERARRERLLEDVGGLLYRAEDSAPNRPTLIHTGVQRLVRDFDELPEPMVGYRLLERPHRDRNLRPKPLALHRMRRNSFYASLVITRGCRFNCEYCPIPAYNQRTWRHKSPARLVREIQDIHRHTGIRHFFGTCDNFFNKRETIQAYFEAMARAKLDGGRSFGDTIDFSTEATEIDVYRHRDLLPLARRGGLRGLFFGIEDLDAKLVNKGQTPTVTLELFEHMVRLGISPQVLMMHYEGQPLLTPGGVAGLFDQVDFLQRHGAVGYQCTIYSPAIGTRAFGPALDEGVVFRKVAGRMVPDSHYDGNHVVAYTGDKPWQQQWNVLRAYARFYSVPNLVKAIFARRDPCRMTRIIDQLIGLAGLPVTFRRHLRWVRKLKQGPIIRWPGVPQFPFPVIHVGDGPEPGGLIQMGVRQVDPNSVATTHAATA